MLTADKCIIIFLCFSVLGWIWESIYCTIKNKKWANRGFLYGPICPIYGFGGLIGFIVYYFLPSLSWIILFAAGFVVSMILEYPTSWLLEKLFHARWWDYSDIPLNINGRTSVPTSAAFGVAAILVMKVILPLLTDILSLTPLWLEHIAVYLFISVISADITLTVCALTNFQKHVNEVDDAFHNHMENAVYKVIESGNKVYAKAINRISVFKYPARKANVAQKMREKRFADLMQDYLDSPEIQQMDAYIQHGDTTTLEHCKNVAWVSFLVNERLHLNANEKELIEAAMLHDFYLYDWHDGKPERKRHGFDHPYIASENSEKTFHVSPKVYSSIRSHMWPLNITEIPKSKEAIILTITDKYCAVIETLRKNNIN